jgi:hypothetical protein
LIPIFILASFAFQETEMAEDLAAEKMNMIHSYLASQKLFAASRVFQRPLQGSVASQVPTEKTSYQTDERMTPRAVEQLHRPGGQSSGIWRSSPLLKPRTSSQNHISCPSIAVDQVRKESARDKEKSSKRLASVTNESRAIPKTSKTGARKQRLAPENEDSEHAAREFHNYRYI